MTRNGLGISSFERMATPCWLDTRLAAYFRGALRSFERCAVTGAMGGTR
jgi:hypothetical protein